MREKLDSGQLAPNVYVYAQGLDSQPRCRIDGAFADSDDEDNATASAVSTFGSTTTATANSKQGQPKPSASTMGWMPAYRVAQLRWSVPRLLHGENGEEEAANDKESEDLIAKLGYSRGALLDHTAMAIRCVEILLRLCESSSSRDAATGGIIRPLPRPRRTITNPQHLPHIVQVGDYYCRFSCGLHPRHAVALE